MFVFLSDFVRVYVCACMSVCLYVWLLMSVCFYVCKFERLYDCMRVGVSMVCVCVRVCMCVSLYVCMIGLFV